MYVNRNGFGEKIFLVGMGLLMGAIQRKTSSFRLVVARIPIAFSFSLRISAVAHPVTEVDNFLNDFVKNHERLVFHIGRGIHLNIHSLIRTFIYSLTYSFIYLFTHLSIHLLLTHLFIHLFIHSLIH